MHVFCALLLVSLVVFNSSTSIASARLTEPSKAGPYVDKVVYQVISADDQQVLSLLNDEIDLIGDSIDPVFLPQLEAAEDIDVANILRNGYGYMTINCAKYPFNITAFRRAVAFAFDKNLISEQIWGDLSQPQDSCIPAVNPWTIEGQLPYTYYEANLPLGNWLLDNAGFDDVDADDFREAPDGSDFDVTIEVASSSSVAIEIGSFMVDALQSLDIDATSVSTDFYEYLNRLYYHGDYDMAFVGKSFTDYDVDWMAYEFWSDYADEPFYNFPNFRNSTFDSWRDQLLSSTVYQDVYEASIEMQKIWVYECPEIICYENYETTAHRNDRFEGFVNDVSHGVPSWWTNYNARLKVAAGGPIGGTLRWSLPMEIDTFNFMTSSSAHSEKVNQMMWDSLLRRSPDGVSIPWLAESYTIETHVDNAAIPDGYTRFTFDLVQNATWSDGYPLTAEDIAFTLNYYRDSLGNPHGVDLVDMTAAYPTTQYRLVAEFDKESYWLLNVIGYKRVLPKHVFADIGVDGWNLWNPAPPSETMVTSGPFNVSEYVSGEFVELTRNPNYFYSVDIDQLPGVPPLIGHPADVHIIYNTYGNQITWYASDGNPASYEIYLDDSPVLQTDWDGTNIKYQIDSTYIGRRNYTLVLYDTEGLTSSDSVIVTVVPGGSGKIVFDYSHGQYKQLLVDSTDLFIARNLTEMGFEVVWALGGINSSILADATGFVAGSIFGQLNGYSVDEVSAIADWFNAGDRFMWVGYDSDYNGLEYVNDNMTAILEGVGSHVYGEPTSVEDPESNCGAAYRCVANRTSNDSHISSIVNSVETVLMHGPTLLYGSTSGFEGTDSVALETTTITDVYPLLYYSQAATIIDSDLVPPYAHSDGDTGAFVAAVMEVNAGAADRGVLVVSGASPYGDYMPMAEDFYYSRDLSGWRFVHQAIYFGMSFAQEADLDPPITDHPLDVFYAEGETGFSITWQPNDDNPLAFEVHLDGELYKSGPWNSTDETITVSVDGLSMGIHNATLVVIDTYLGRTDDTVLIYVIDMTPPTIDSPPDIEYTSGTIGNQIAWHPNDNNPLTYIVYMNDALLRAGFWNSSSESISLSVDELLPGEYNFTLIVMDAGANWASDSVWVSVSDAVTTPTTSQTPTPGDSSPIDIMAIVSLAITVGSLGVIVVVGSMICRARRASGWEGQFA
jgi:ABC-type transport system substrate-binding protein